MSHTSRILSLAPDLRASARTTATILGLTLLAAAPLLAQEEAESGGLFAVNWVGIFVWTWVIFIILFLVLRKWAWGPILGALEARERRIQDTLDEAARERLEAEELLQQHRQMLNQARGEAQEFLAEGRKAGERLKAELVEEAQKQKQEILERSREEIERERDEALATLRREAIDLSIKAASRVLERNLDAEDNRRIVKDYLEVLEKENAGKKG